MDKVAERIDQDFHAFDERMILRRAEEQSKLEKNLTEIHSSVEHLDKELEELKARAYDNVSEKLQGFEDEFFVDLQKRNAQLHQTLDDWQAGLKQQIEDAREASLRDMDDAQRNFAEAARIKTQDLQTTTWAQLDRLERQIHESQEAAAGQIRTHHTELDDTRASLKNELAELEKSLSARYQQEVSRAELEATEAITRLDRETEARLRQISENLDVFRVDTQELVDTTQTEFNTGQARFTQRFKDLEADMGEQYRSFKTSLGEKISALTDEFSLQKEELITRSAEDRASLRSELAQMRSGIDELDNLLRTKTQSAAEAFEREYETSLADFQKKNRDLLLDMENKLRDYRSAVQDTREKAEAMQKKLFGKVEDQANLLAVSLEEIEKKQKSFVNQTKVFERADNLKQELQESIEDLKGDLARIEVQRKDLFDVEASISRVKKLGDETSEKMARFASEKKRIDLMDSDFQRILALSQSMEVRLEQVTSSNDLLQDIQLKIRKLEDYSKDIEIRYERLEKRREVLDNTTDGVDRNFAVLEKVEKSIKGLEGEVRQLPGEVEELRKRLKVLGAGKEDADKAVERLGQLDQLLKDVEGRIGRMEEAREWIARTESRLIETKDAAEAQIGTFATLAKANSPVGTAAKGKSSVDNDLRQTVIKLARQGWGKEEISRATKLSMGEVELILELGPR
jgi:chromosome segregation ATPase